MTIQQAFDTALRYHQDGELRQAEQLYRQILALQPDHGGALHLLGVVAHQVGRNDVAADLIGRALAVRPDWPDALSNLGEVQRALGQLDDAIASFRRAIALKGDDPQAHSNLGNALWEKGEAAEAAAACRRAIALRPNFPEPHNNLGNALRETGQREEAIAAYRQAIALRPDFPEAHSNLGNTLRETGQLDEAIAALRQAIALKPDYPAAYGNLASALKAKGQLDDAAAAYRKALDLKGDDPGIHNDLGNILKDKGQLDEAVACYRRAIALRGDFAEAHSNLGNVLRDVGQLEEAVAACDQAIALKPDNPGAHNNLGNARQDMGQLDQAIASYRRAVARDPNFAQAHNNLGAALKTSGQLDEAVAACRQAIACDPDYADAYSNLGVVLLARGQIEEALDACRRAIALRPGLPEAHNNLGKVLKDTGQLDESIAESRRAVALKPDFAEAHSNLILTLHYGVDDARVLAEENRRWARQHADPLRAIVPNVGNDRDPDRRLRIGYVSPDYRNHPVGRFLLPLLAHHDKSAVEIFAYAQVPVPDAMTERLRSRVDVWRNIVGLSDAAAAELVRQDRIDVLVDLAMHTANNRLLVFARKPAPVQVTWLAYCSSTGMEAIDYRLSDPYLDPPGEDESIYSERTVRLPETYWCYQQAMDAPEPGPPPAPREGKITFGCLNNFCKVTERALSAWARLLGAVPDSRLLLHAHQGGHQDHVRRRLERERIASNRISFAGFMPSAKYLELYRQIDIALDTFPFGGGTTTCDALWMGVPVVTLVGRTAVGRGGLSILSNIGLPELAARSEEQYVRLATELAGDLPRLGELRRTLRDRMEQSPLMDAPRFARNVESAYRQMWREWCAGTSPNVISAAAS